MASTKLHLDAGRLWSDVMALAEITDPERPYTCAGHDAAFMSRICPSAMIFVPSRKGKSHSPEEWADREAIARGAAVVLQAVKTLDRSLPRKQ